MSKNVTSAYDEGDFVIQFNGCDEFYGRDCPIEAEPYSKIWKKAFGLEQ